MGEPLTVGELWAILDHMHMSGDLDDTVIWVAYEGVVSIATGITVVGGDGQWAGVYIGNVEDERRKLPQTVRSIPDRE